MKVIITETTVVAYEVNIQGATTASEAKSAAWMLFERTLDPTVFKHDVVANYVDCDVQRRRGE